MMHSKLYNRPLRGTTLVETLVFAAIGSMILVAVSTIYFSGLNARTLVDAQQRLLTVDEFVFATVKSRFEEASYITIPSSGTGTQLVIDDPQDVPDVQFTHSGTDLFLTIGNQSPVRLNMLGVRVVQFDVMRLSSEPEGVRLSVTYEVDTTRQRVIQFQNTFTLLLRYE